MAQPNQNPFFRGQNVTFKFYQDGAKVLILCKNWSVEQNATEINDGVNGELRDRLDIVTNYFSADCDVYQKDQEVMQAIIDAQAANDAQGAPLQQQCAIQINQRDGGRAAYLLQNVVMGPFSESMTSRADAVMLKLKFRFTDYSSIPSI